jgi:hypothetical protein
MDVCGILVMNSDTLEDARDPSQCNYFYRQINTDEAEQAMRGHVSLIIKGGATYHMLTKKKL